MCTEYAKHAQNMFSHISTLHGPSNLASPFSRLKGHGKNCQPRCARNGATFPKVVQLHRAGHALPALRQAVEHLLAVDEEAEPRLPRHERVVRPVELRQLQLPVQRQGVRVVLVAGGAGQKKV